LQHKNAKKLKKNEKDAKWTQVNLPLKVPLSSLKILQKCYNRSITNIGEKP